MLMIGTGTRAIRNSSEQLPPHEAVRVGDGFEITRDGEGDRGGEGSFGACDEPWVSASLFLPTVSKEVGWCHGQKGH